MLYTRKGDNGTTKAFDSKPGQRKSKSSCQTEALGALDELNSFLGLVKIKSASISSSGSKLKHDKSAMNSWKILDKSPAEIVAWIQNSLFTVQAEVAGAGKRVGQNKVLEMERMIDSIEHELPPIKTFFISVSFS